MARLDSLTRYSTGAPELFQRFSRWKHSAFLEVLNALSDTLLFIRLCSDIQQALIGLGVLHDCFGFSVDGENDGLLAFFQMSQGRGWIPPKCGHRLNVAFDIEHMNLMGIMVAPLKVFKKGVAPNLQTNREKEPV